MGVVTLFADRLPASIRGIPDTDHQLIWSCRVQCTGTIKPEGIIAPFVVAQQCAVDEDIAIPVNRPKMQENGFVFPRRQGG